jgi:hypothetical protein
MVAMHAGALVAQVDHGGLRSKLGHGSVLEDAARLRQEGGERFRSHAVAVHERRAFGWEQHQTQVAFAPPTHRDVLGQTRR